MPANAPWTLEKLEQHFPWIQWRKPRRVERTGGDWGFACPICLANEGLRAADVPRLPQDYKKVVKHIREAHGGLKRAIESEP